MAFAFDNNNKAADLFLRAFKECVKNIVRKLPSDVSKSDAISAIQTITQKLSGDYARLIIVNETLQARIWEDESWAASASVDIYELLAATVDPELSVSSLPMRGAHWVCNELMKMCQAQFQRMVDTTNWNHGFINFLSQLYTTGRTTSTTPDIVLYILDNMISSASLAVNDNFNLLMTFLMRARLYLDSQKEFQEHFRTGLQHLQQRGRSFKVSWWLAIEGYVQLHERGWPVEAVEAMQDDKVSNQQPSDGASR